MDDMQSTELRRRAHAAGLGIDWSREDDHAVASFVAWAAPSQAEENAPRAYPLARRATAAAPAPVAARRAAAGPVRGAGRGGGLAGHAVARRRRGRDGAQPARSRQ